MHGRRGRGGVRATDPAHWGVDWGGDGRRKRAYELKIGLGGKNDRIDEGKESRKNKRMNYITCTGLNFSSSFL